MTESQVARKFRAWCTKQGFLFIKLTALGWKGQSGWPDYLVIGLRRMCFVELKSSTGKLTKLQESRIKKLGRLGHRVYVYRGEPEVLDAIQARLSP